MTKLVDFHIHIDYFKNYKEMYHFLNSNEIYALFVTNLPEIYDKCKKEFIPSKFVSIALGYNPQFISTHAFNKQVFNKWFEDTKYIGEVGLDFSKEFISSKEIQCDVFRYICKKAGKANKILSIHSRKAENETLKILVENNVRFAVFHWYTGELNLIDEILSKGYYFSINYSMLTSAKGKKIIERIPTDRLLIESDGPFGRISKKTNEPYNLKTIYEEMGIFLRNGDLSSVVFNNLKNLLEANLKQMSKD